MPIICESRFKDTLYTSPLSGLLVAIYNNKNQLSRGAKTIEYKHIMDDNAGGYYDQHVYISHRIANMVMRAIIKSKNM